MIEDCYKTLIRPILEYAGTVWDPYTQQNIDKLETIQKRAAHYVTGDHRRTSSIKTMIENLKWKSLAERRAQARVTMLYKAIKDLVDLPTDLLIPSTVTTRGHKKKYQIPFSRTNIHQYSFYPRTIITWNNLTSAAVECKTLDSFRREVQKSSCT